MAVMARTGQRMSGLALAADQGCRRRTGRQIELEENVGDMPLHGVIAEPQLLGDRGVAEAVGDKAQDLAFPRAQYLQSGRPRGVAVRFEVLLCHDGQETHVAVYSL